MAFSAPGTVLPSAWNLYRRKCIQRSCQFSWIISYSLIALANGKTGLCGTFCGCSSQFPLPVHFPFLQAVPSASGSAAIRYSRPVSCRLHPLFSEILCGHLTVLSTAAIQNYFFIPCCRSQLVHQFTFGDCNGSGNHSIVYCFIPLVSTRMYRSRSRYCSSSHVISMGCIVSFSSIFCIPLFILFLLFSFVYCKCNAYVSVCQGFLRQLRSGLAIDIDYPCNFR